MVDTSPSVMIAQQPILNNYNMLRNLGKHLLSEPFCVFPNWGYFGIPYFSTFMVAFVYNPEYLPKFLQFIGPKEKDDSNYYSNLIR